MFEIYNSKNQTLVVSERKNFGRKPKWRSYYNTKEQR